MPTSPGDTRSILRVRPGGIPNAYQSLLVLGNACWKCPNNLTVSYNTTYHEYSQDDGLAQNYRLQTIRKRKRNGWSLKPLPPKQRNKYINVWSYFRLEPSSRHQHWTLMTVDQTVRMAKRLEHSNRQLVRPEVAQPPDLTTRAKAFIRAVLNRDYEAVKHDILIQQIVFMKKYPGTPFDYIPGAVSIQIERVPMQSPGGSARDWFLALKDYSARESRSSGTLELHLIQVGEGSNKRRPVFLCGQRIR
ncbi:hypothetical protein C8J57DRAFT_1459016 [Mycena rebaudengoi]|nr:hypothetical protein C8J57DRAFT_1459016 [Mycena rebaudengoi]